MKQILFPKKGAKKTQKPKGPKFLTLVLSVMFPAVFCGLHAQRTLNVTGGSAVISGNVYAYSIGEIVLVSTVKKPNLIVTQGLLQSNVDELDVQEVNLLAEGLDIYPNPVGNTLFLQASLPGGGELSLQLFDLRGRLVMKDKLNLNSGFEKQGLDLSPLQGGTYLLQANLQQEERIYRYSFKIIKIQ